MKNYSGLTREEFYQSMVEQTIQVIHDNYDEWTSGELTLEQASLYPILEAFDVNMENAQETRKMVNHVVSVVLERLDNQII